MEDLKYYRPSNTSLNLVQNGTENNDTLDVHGGSLIDGFKGVRNYYPPSSYHVLKDNFNHKIVTMRVFRRPVSGAIEKALNLVSMGKWGQSKQKYGYDTFFHVGMIVTLSNGKKLVIEKNHVINIDYADGLQDPKKWGLPYSDMKRVSMRPEKLGEFMNKVEQKMGAENMFHYSPFSKNCQNFLLNALLANGLLTFGLRQWIYQPIDKVIGEQKKHVGKLAQAVTDMGSVVNRIMEGDVKNKDAKIERNEDDENDDNNQEVSVEDDDDDEGGSLFDSATHRVLRHFYNLFNKGALEDLIRYHKNTTKW
jgi:hypothetical protein